MNTRALILPIALATALISCSSAHHGGDNHSHHGEAAAPEMHDAGDAMGESFDEMMAGMSAEEQAMFAAWGPFMTPGTQHAGLASTAGTWNLHITHWVTPDAEPMESGAVSVLESFGGGRYLLERTEGDGPAGSFQGFGITGFNNRTGRYFNTWIDNMGTGVMSSEGTGDPNARVIRYTGTVDDPISGGTSNLRTERRVVNENTFLFEMWMEMNGQEFKGMIITYTRA